MDDLALCDRRFFRRGGAVVVHHRAQRVGEIDFGGFAFGAFREREQQDMGGAEERGFFGASILLLLYLLIVWRALRIVTSARDMYSAIVAGGIAFMFMFQVFVNAAMTMGIAPITGIPLPFVSVGGSSMITNFLAIGILQAIYLRRPLKRRSN